MVRTTSGIRPSFQLAEVITGFVRGLESKFEQTLNPKLPFIARLDGVAFRTLTKNLHKPFDPRMTEAMLQTTFHLVDRFNAQTAFVQSDEISLVFAPVEDASPPLYGRRVQKIVSVLASYASAFFNKQMEFQGGEIAAFDARVFECPDESAVMRAIYWRHTLDCRRNAINSICQHHLRTSLHSRPQQELILELRRRGIELSQFDPFNIYGAFVKRIEIDHIGYNPITRQQIPTKRTRLEARSINWYHEDRGSFLTNKLWDETLPQDNTQSDLAPLKSLKTIRFENERLGGGFAARPDPSLNNKQ